MQHDTSAEEGKSAIVELTAEILENENVQRSALHAKPMNVWDSHNQSSLKLNV